jgi:hypothetical protein
MARAVADRVGGDPGYPGLSGPLTLPPSRQLAKLGLLRTAGWPYWPRPRVRRWRWRWTGCAELA